MIGCVAEQQLGPEWTLMRDGQKGGRQLLCVMPYTPKNDCHSPPLVPCLSPPLSPLAFPVLNLSNYLKETLPEGSVVGLDPRVHPIKFVTSLAKTLAPKKITLQPIGTALESLGRSI